MKLFIRLSRIHAVFFLFSAVMLLVGCGGGGGDSIAAPDPSPLNPGEIPSIGEATPDVSIFGDSTFGTATWSK